MTFDDGYHPGMTSSDDFRAKFASLLDEYDMSFREMCRLAHVDELLAMRAIDQGMPGLMSNAGVLQQLLSVFKVDIAWISGAPDFIPKHGSRAVKSISPDEASIELPTTEQRRALRTKTWDFLLRHHATIPKSHRRRFTNYVLSLLESRPQHTMKLAARPPVPRTAVDFQHLYDRLRREGFFTNGTH